ncbi:MAG: sugar nucleotide-binding protein [Bacteroidales bacterium]|nr:sugar nucleotide-binding protein [Lachnoclostridium sp.]MCM1383623.1 sugar nucleotide-binding protein [Lachnoclostridium sp.]MCM1465705.1 sugar nucleotide-binding protein [Bacteroidales bacterium]
MNVLLIGGSGSLINNLIIKFNKEGHRVYLLTGSRFEKRSYQKVFEKYNFTYDSASLNEIFESINPELTVYMGAYDTNFAWHDEEAEAVKYSASLMNLLMGYAMRCQGRFIYLSSENVYSGSYDGDISETEPVTPAGIKGMTLAQGEEMCESYRKNRGLDIITLRLDHLYSIPQVREDVADICSRMCLEILEKNTLTVDDDSTVSLLYEADAVEFIYRIAACREHKHPLYHISTSAAISEPELADIVKSAMGESAWVFHENHGGGRRILSNRLFDSEFGNPFFCDMSDIIHKVAAQMKSNKYVFLNAEEKREPLKDRILKKAGWLIGALVPFVENMIAFIPFFMLNNRAVGSEYFANLDFYLLYVLLFAIIYGQQQATFSALLAIAGYSFRQMYDRTGFEVFLDANTYVWIAQLFILGLTVGYMRDQITKLKRESREETEFISLQLNDIQDINSSNVRVKDALETQIVNQNDSVGKIYSITSALDRYSPEEVLFYAAEVLGELIKSKDVAIYTISNSSYARLFSSTSRKARMLGNSIRYVNMGEMYETLMERRVFINRRMDERYPLMANAIFEDEEMRMILMVWGIPWESMTLGQANQLVVISSLIQNAVLRANKYMEALTDTRYLEGTKILEPEAFDALVNAYLKAERKGLTECALLKMKVEPPDYEKAGTAFQEKLRQTDYVGILPNGKMYILLANTDEADTTIVVERFAEMGYGCDIVEDGQK